MSDTESKIREYTLQFSIGLGDDSLMLGQRLGEWCRNAPMLEEDLAISNVALDFLGRANMYYEYAVELAKIAGGDFQDQSVDDIAYLRDSREYRNLLIFEMPIGDFAYTMTRQLIVDLFNVEYFTVLSGSGDLHLAAIAAKTLKESKYHLRRSHDWTLRLGDGTEESHLRMQNAVNELWGYTPELFEMTEAELGLLPGGISVDRAGLFDTWDARISQILSEATLDHPPGDWQVTGGRAGVHTEYHGHLLSELQYLQRAYPGLSW